MQIDGSAGGGSFDNENLLIADAAGTLILGMDGQNSKIINNDLIELQNSVQNTKSIIEIAGTLFLQNREVLGLGSNIAGNVIVSDGHAAELVLDGGTLDGVGQLGDNNLTLVIAALTYVVSSSGVMLFDPVATTIQPTGVLEAIDGSVMRDFSAIANQGTIAALGGGKIEVTDNITNSNGGVVNIGANSEIILEGDVVVSGTIQFTGSNATLATTASISTQTTVSGTGTGDSFDFLDEGFFSGDHAIFQQSGGTGTLSVLNSGGTTIASVTLAGQYTSADFIATADSSGNLLVRTNLASPTPPTPPVTNRDLYITKAGTALTVAAASGVLANDTDQNGLSLSATLGQTTAHGTLVLNHDGSFTYTPQAGFVGTDSFTYTASDTASSSTVMTSNIVVGALNALTSPSQMLSELYVGYYDRAPDVSGLNYWLANYSTPPGQSAGGVNPFYQNLGQAAASFADPHQTETVALYPFLANPSTANYSQVVTFVDSAYENLFNRSADTVGEEYWSTSIAKSLGIAVPVFGNPTIDNDGPVSAAQALLALINGAQGNDGQTIANKVTAGLYYYELLGANNVSPTQASAHAAFSGVTSDPATVLASEAATNAFVYTALHSSAAMIAPVGMLDSVQSLQNGA